MTEEFLYYIWQQRLFITTELLTINNEPVIILNPGFRNTNAGPDFLQAKIRIGKTTWAGNVEMHIKTSDWNKHGHQRDEAYSNVVLHVVYEHDVSITDKTNTVVPTLELKDNIDPAIYQKYHSLTGNLDWIPCEKQIHQIDDFTIKNGLHRLLVERLENKISDIEARLFRNKNNWEETCYQLVARNFGLKINTEPFDRLATSLPQNIIAKHKNNPFQIEALIFGQAGMLGQNFEDEYPVQLKKEYHFLKKKFGLRNLPAHMWKFLRLRPPSFPTVRLAQFSMLLYRSTHLFSRIIEENSPKALMEFFTVGTSDYWDDHYRFDTLSIKRKKVFGKNAIHTLIINTVVPLLFVYGRKKGEQFFEERAINLLEQLPAEKNVIINKWASIRYQAISAYETQALLQLKQGYCDNKKCLNCFIGNKIITSAC